MSEIKETSIDDFFNMDIGQRSDDEVLHMVRRVRISAVDGLIKNGIPNTKDELELLNVQLTELSKDAHKNKKLDQDERANANNHEQIIAMTDLMLAQMGKQPNSPFTPRDIKADLAEIPTATAEVSETLVGDDGRTFEDFDREVGERVQKANAERFKQLDDL